jgi:hypothetical protein
MEFYRGAHPALSMPGQFSHNFRLSYCEEAKFNFLKALLGISSDLQLAREFGSGQLFELCWLIGALEQYETIVRRAALEVRNAQTAIAGIVPNIDVIREGEHSKSSKYCQVESDSRGGVFPSHKLSQRRSVCKLLLHSALELLS